jgi:hypothetical protein
MSAETAREAVLALVTDYYRDSSNPLFLSGVGQTLRSKGLWPIEGETRSLKEWLTTLEPEIRVLQDPLIPARVAIVTPEKAERVGATIEGLRNAKLVAGLQRPVLLAFCVRAEEETTVYLTREAPFRYTLVRPENPGDYWAIEPHYRSPGLPLRAVTKMGAGEVARLGEGISNWARDHNVDLGRLTKQAAEAAAEQEKDVPAGALTALGHVPTKGIPRLVAV